MIKTLKEALEYIHWLGARADICVYRETGRQCEGCMCKKFKNNNLQTEECQRDNHTP